MLTAPLLYQQSEFHTRKHTFCRGGSKRSRCFILLYLAKQKANYRPQGDTKDPGYIRAAILWNGILFPRNCSFKIHTRIQMSFFFFIDRGLFHFYPVGMAHTEDCAASIRRKCDAVDGSRTKSHLQLSCMSRLHAVSTIMPVHFMQTS